jgi:Zn-dependent M28 family amino/carboxypeptidase
MAGRPEWRGVSVLNVDMVGAGDRLVYISRDGLLWPRRTDARLNALLARAAPGIGELPQTLRSGDHLPFLERGIPATTLQAAGSAAAERAYHTEQDTPAVLEVEALARAAQAVRGVVDTLEFE